jgi:LppP/LprE lipoprotein
MAGGAIPGRAPVRPAIAMTVRSASVKWAVVIGVAALTVAVAGCGSSDSTASKTPEPTVTAPAPATAHPSSPPMPSVATPTTTAAADPCAINLAAPEIVKAVSELPRDPRSNQAWNPEPLAGNFNECAQLSAVIVKANTNSENPNTRAVLFHLGKFIPTGVPDTYGFNGIDESATTGDTIALRYSGGIEGLDSVVKFRWNGNGVELIGNTPG